MDITLHLPADLGQQIKTIQDKDEFIVHALETALEKYQRDLKNWQAIEMQEGIKEADAGNYASDEEV